MAAAKAAPSKVNESSLKIDFSDEALKKAWKDTTDSKSTTNWILTKLSDDGKKLELVETGATGLKGFKEKLAAASGKALFGALEVVAADKRGGVTSRRYKYLFVTFIGSGIQELAKAQLNFAKGPVGTFLSGTAMNLDLTTNTLHDLQSKDIATRLLAAGGAHKPNSFIFGPGDEINVDDLATADSDDD